MPTFDLSTNLAQDAQARHVLARLADFFADTSPWTRRLWQVSSVLALEEAAEAGTWLDNRSLSTSAMTWFLRAAERQLGPDCGLGESGLRREITVLLRSGLGPQSRERRRLVQLIPHVREGYLDRWATEIAAGKSISAERLARVVATHLLDLGHSSGALHRWARSWLTEPSATVGDLITSANRLAHQSSQTFSVLVPFSAVPQAHLASYLPEWLPANQTSQWLTDRGFDPIRTAGAFLYEVIAMDPVAAAREAGSRIRRLETRRFFSRGTPRALQPIGHVWVQGHPTALPLRPPQRGVTVLALERERIMYTLGDAANNRLDEALELAGALNSGPTASAAAGAWAAVESLLVQPDDPGDQSDGRAIAATRLAAIVACSWPRAELTALAHRCESSDRNRAITRTLADCLTNLHRCEVIAVAIALTKHPLHATDTDRAAAARMRTVLDSSHAQINDVAKTFEDAFRRLYRQRNIVVHGGSTASIGLEPALRIAAPLFGAGLDRLLHAQITENLKPLELAARAENALLLVGDEHGPLPTRLLESA